MSKTVSPLRDRELVQMLAAARRAPHRGRDLLNGREGWVWLERVPCS